MTQNPFIPGQFYHVYNRANGSDKIFLQERNYYYFLKKFGDYMADTFEVMAYCLLPNHFHFFVRTRAHELVHRCWLRERRTYNQTFHYSSFVSGRQKAWLSGYAQAINKQEGRRGSLFMHNTKRRIIWDASYLMNIIHYIHLNPFHHGYVENFEDWSFSSYKYLVNNHLRSPSWLEKDILLNWFAGRDAFIDSHLWSRNVALNKHMER